MNYLWQWKALGIFNAGESVPFSSFFLFKKKTNNFFPQSVFFPFPEICIFPRIMRVTARIIRTTSTWFQDEFISSPWPHSSKKKHVNSLWKIRDQRVFTQLSHCFQENKNIIKEIFLQKERVACTAAKSFQMVVSFPSFLNHVMSEISEP